MTWFGEKQKASHMGTCIQCAGIIYKGDDIRLTVVSRLPQMAAHDLCVPVDSIYQLKKDLPNAENR